MKYFLFRKGTIKEWRTKVDFEDDKLEFNLPEEKNLPRTAVAKIASS